MNVRLIQIEKTFRGRPVLRGITLEIASRELFFLVGPSGCGKTTLLRLIAGLWEPDRGEIWFGDRKMNGIPPHRRGTAMVFQNYALWPHMTVEENVAYGLETQRIPRSERRQRVQEALAMVRLQGLEDRYPHQLSGGQQQRVALARALVTRPQVLLLDEPLSNLDAGLRLAMREEIRRIHEQAQVTTIYVTHDQEEALAMADRIAVLQDGQILQVGDPRTLYRHPANRFVADFLGRCNWLEATVLKIDGQTVLVQSPAGPLRAHSQVPVAPGQPVWLGFRPENVSLHPPDTSDSVPNPIQGTIEHIFFQGPTERYLIRLPSQHRIEILCWRPQTPYALGQRVRISIPPADLWIFPKETAVS